MHFLDLIFLSTQLETVFANDEGRPLFPVLIGKLVNDTGKKILTRVSFPAHNDHRRRGWDGMVEAQENTEWIPAGSSVWELGTNKDIKGKVKRDFEKRTKNTDRAERMTKTYIFVTPRHWDSKDSWEKAREKEKLWKDVRVYDASDLEQWIENSPLTKVWLAHLLKLPLDGIRTLDRCWDDWAQVGNVRGEVILPPCLFFSAIEKGKNTLKEFLQQKNKHHLSIAASSADEALAFLSQALLLPELEAYRDRVLVFDNPESLIQLASYDCPGIAIAYTPAVQCQFPQFESTWKTISIYPRYDGSFVKNQKIDFTLRELSLENFFSALNLMNKTYDESRRLYHITGKSRGALRRQLATNGAIRVPFWASNKDYARKLIPFVLAGQWATRNPEESTAEIYKDKIFIAHVAGVSLEELEDNFSELKQLAPCPVWEIFPSQGVNSQVEALIALRHHLSGSVLKRFLTASQKLLSDQNPVFRTAASSIDETNGEALPIYSRLLRENVGKTLAYLAMHGPAPHEAQGCIINLLSSPQSFNALAKLLPLFAEAVPGSFIEFLEEDLQKSLPIVQEAMSPISRSVVLTFPQLGLRDALGRLAWSSAYFERTVLILGALSERYPNDSADNFCRDLLFLLESIFSPVKPQTTASLERRIRAISSLLEKHPRIGWSVCLKHISPENKPSPPKLMFHPEWTSEIRAEVVSAEEVRSFVKEMVELAINRPHYDVHMLCDLVAKLPVLEKTDQDRVWKLVETFIKRGISDEEIVLLRDTIRQKIFLLWRVKKIDVYLRDEAKIFYDSLHCEDLSWEYEWLFRENWIPQLFDSSSASGTLIDHDSYTQYTQKLQLDALEHIFKEKGLSGVLSLAAKAKTYSTICSFLTSGTISDGGLEALTFYCLTEKNENFTLGVELFSSLSGPVKSTVLKKIKLKVSDEQFLKLLLLLPLQFLTWQWVENLPLSLRIQYWEHVDARFLAETTPEEVTFTIENLLLVNRPKKALFIGFHYLENLPSNLLTKLLNDINHSIEIEFENYKLEDFFQII